MSIKQDIINALTTPAVGSSPYDIVTNCDHIMRRLFRVFIEGSYGNGCMNDHRGTVKALHDIVNRHSPKAKHRALRSWVIHQHTSFIAAEFKCSPSHAQKCVVQAFGDSLPRYTIALMADAMNFYFDNKSALEVNE